MKSISRKLAGVALATAAAAGLALSASPASAEITPIHRMNCTKWVSGSTGNYWGNAGCTGTGYWYLKVDCSWGLTYYGPKVFQTGGTQYARAGSCYWGVNSVQIVEVNA